MPRGVFSNPVERAKKISEKMMGNKNGRLGGRKIGSIPWNKGKKDCISTEARKKMSDSKTGKKGELSNPWKGDKTKYSGIHRWLIKNYGNAKKCVHCQKTTGRFQWANIDQKYGRSIENYIELCPSCHKKYDLEYVKNNRDNLQ